MTILPLVEPAPSENRNPPSLVQAEKKPGKVRVVNSPWNGNGMIRRTKAEHYVQMGRAEWLDANHLKMLMSHPANMVAAGRAAAGYADINRTMTQQELRHVPLIVVRSRPGRTSKRSGTFATINFPKTQR